VQARGHADANTNSYCHTYGDGHIQSYANAYSYAYSNANTNSYCNRDSDRHVHTYLNT